jgi:hypothetical protein
MCWKLLLSLFVGYNDNIPFHNMKKYTLNMIGKNTELNSLSTYTKYRYYDKDLNANEKFCGYDKRTNDMYDNDIYLASNISDILRL